MEIYLNLVTYLEKTTLPLTTNGSSKLLSPRLLLIQNNELVRRDFA